MKCIPRLLVLAVLVVLAGLCDVQAKEPDLPRAASPREVAQLLAKPPAGLEIVDIRPPAEFSDYALPGSLNLDAATVLADESLLTGTGPLLVVDKDGSRAFAVAGVLAQRASRPVLALTGGLSAWWAAMELGAVVKETPLPGVPAQAPGTLPAKSTGPAKPAPGAAPVPGTPDAPSPAAPSPAPQTPASKGAGC